MKRATLFTIALLVVGAVAVPAMAQPDGHGRPDEAGRDAPDRHRDGNHSDNRSADERPARNESRGPPGHVLERLEARCAAVENETGERPPACDRLAQIHDGAHQARRAAHAGMQALAAWEHLNATLAKLEEKFEAKLAAGNLTENQTAAFEAKLERIDAMQENLTAKIERMEAKIDGMKERWQEVRDHVAERRAHRGDDADDADASDDADDADDDDDADDGSDGNSTADP